MQTMIVPMAPRSSHSFLFATSLPRAQRGAALFLLLLLVLVGAGTVFVSQLKSADLELEAQRKTAAALAEAKQALLGKAILDDGGVVVNPGRLPCPDQDNDGDAQGSVCSGPPFVGRLPWKTLNVGDIRDGSAERLWYVVDGNFRSGNGALNTTKAPTLVLNGMPVVAVVFAPGEVLAALGQNRATAGAPNPSLQRANYVEGFGTGASINTAAKSVTYNDQTIAITPNELFTAVTLRMAWELAKMNATPYAPSMNPSEPLQNLIKPTPIWSNNDWNNAVDIAGTNVTTTQVTLKFLNCGIVYVISGSGSVGMNQKAC